MGMLTEQDPGQVDVTSEEGAVRQDIIGAPATPQSGAAVAAGMADKTPSADAAEEEATPDEQAEYERATDALTEVLYRNEDTSRSVVNMLQPKDKIGSTVQATALVLNQLDQKLDLDENIIAQLTQDIADRIMDLGEQVKGMTFSDREAQAVAGASWEAVQKMYGTDESAYNNLVGGLGEGGIKKYEEQFNQFLKG